MILVLLFYLIEKIEIVNELIKILKKRKNN
jgi:hypothetical protein